MSFSRGSAVSLIFVVFALFCLNWPSEQRTIEAAKGEQSKVPPQNSVDGFVARVYRNARETMPYRLFIPNEYNRQQKYPLMVWLHGAEGRGNDNLAQIRGDQIPGTHTWTKPEIQAKYPAFVLVPQDSGGWGQPSYLSRDTLTGPLVLVVDIVDSLKSEFSIDPKRIYVAGQSLGGMATWDLISKRPELFAAAIPLCGSGNPARAARLVNLPLWAFHGDADISIPVAGSRQMIAAVQKAGGHPRYTEYKGVGHDIWSRAFAEPGLVDWLFAQHN